jgi:hypothetical protein
MEFKKIGGKKSSHLWHSIYTIIAAIKSATRPSLSIGIFIYILILVLATDCFIWYAARSLSNYTAEELIMYSVFAYPLWTLIGVKGLASEQSDLIESGRWQALDLLPGSPTSILVGSSIGQTIKNRAFVIWIFLYVVTSALTGVHLVSIVGSVLAIGGGMVNICLIQVIAMYLSPKGYSGIFGAIVRNGTFLLSGAALPLGMMSDSKYLILFSPISSAVSVPLTSLIRRESVYVGAEVAGYWSAFLLVQCIWILLFLCIGLSLERSRREFLHA